MTTTIDKIRNFSKNALEKSKTSKSFYAEGIRDTLGHVLDIIEKNEKNPQRPKRPVAANFFPILDDDSDLEKSLSGIEVESKIVESLEFSDVQHLKMLSLLKSMEKAVFIRYSVGDGFNEKPEVYLGKSVFLDLLGGFLSEW